MLVLLFGEVCKKRFKQSWHVVASAWGGVEGEVRKTTPLPWWPSGGLTRVRRPVQGFTHLVQPSMTSLAAIIASSHAFAAQHDITCSHFVFET